jgi:hypothetical protein
MVHFLPHVGPFANVNRFHEQPLPIFAAVLHLVNIYRLPNITGGTVIISLTLYSQVSCIQSMVECSQTPADLKP